MTYQPVNLIPAEVVKPQVGLTPEGLGSYIPTYLAPPAIAQAYGIPNSNGYGVKIGIFSFGGGWLQSDLNKSFADLQTAGLINSSLTAPVIRQVLLDGQTGTFTNTGPDGENTVDIYCTACTAPQAQITIYIGNYISSMVTAAIADGMHIISMSWGSSEYTSDEIYFKQLSDAKITFLASSGDYGSVVSPSSSTIGVVYPSSSPYAISAGGTKLTLTNLNARSAETDDNRDSNFPAGWGGGGGVSTTFSTPSFQSNLSYIPITNSVTGSTTPLTMRGTPDFSAPMNVYVFYQNGSIGGAGGTSLSCPVLAGIMARYLQLTGVRRSSIDWNTIAYSHPSAFYDITVGTNNSKITSGYAGTTGWDPVTGLGPPVGNLLYTAIRSGGVFPKNNYGFRPSSGATYPRKTVGAR